MKAFNVITSNGRRKRIKKAIWLISVMLFVLFLTSGTLNNFNYSFVTSPAPANAYINQNAISGAAMMEQVERQRKIEEVEFIANWVYNNSAKSSRSTVSEYTKYIFDHVGDESFQLLTVGMLLVESTGNPRAKSPKGAVGLCQIVPGYWKQRLVKNGVMHHNEDLMNSKVNIRAFQYVMGQCYVDGGKDYRAALKLYYGAPANSYVDKVLGKVGELSLLLHDFRKKQKIADTRG